MQLGGTVDTYFILKYFLIFFGNPEVGYLHGVAKRVMLNLGIMLPNLKICLKIISELKRKKFSTERK